MKLLPVLAGLLALSVFGPVQAQSAAPSTAPDAPVSVDASRAQRVADVVAARLQAAGRLDPKVVMRCADEGCRIKIPGALDALAMLAVDVAATNACKVALTLYGFTRSPLEASSTSTGACDDARLAAVAGMAASNLLNTWGAIDLATRSGLTKARDTGIGFTAAGAVLTVVGGIAGGVLASAGCGKIVDDECSNTGKQIGGAVILFTTVPIGVAMITAGAAVWGVYQRRIDRFDAVASRASIVGVGPLYGPRTGAKGLAATFAF